MKGCLFSLVVLLAVMSACSEEDHPDYHQQKDYVATLLMQFDEVPPEIRENATKRTVEILEKRFIDLKMSAPKIEVRKDELKLHFTSGYSIDQLNFLLSAEGHIQLWRGKEGAQVMDDLVYAEGKLPFVLDSVPMDNLDTLTFSSLLMQDTLERMSRVGAIESRDIYKLQLLLKKSLMHGLLDPTISFFEEFHNPEDSVLGIYAVDTTSASNKLLTNSQVRKVRVVETESNAVMLEITLNESGLTYFREYSLLHVGDPIVVMVDDYVVANPTLSTLIQGESFRVRITLSHMYADILETILNISPTPVGLAVIEIREESGQD